MGLPRGECWLTRLADGRIRIDRADPRILISAELLDEIAHNPARSLSLEPPPGGCDLTYTGAVLRIQGVNRTVVYRITGYILNAGAMTAEWPD